MELQEARGKLSRVSREASRPHQVLHHIKACTNRDPPSAEEVDKSCIHTSALILPSEEQYSKCRVDGVVMRHNCNYSYNL